MESANWRLSVSFIKSVASCFLPVRREIYDISCTLPTAHRAEGSQTPLRASYGRYRVRQRGQPTVKTLTETIVLNEKDHKSSSR